MKLLILFAALLGTSMGAPAAQSLTFHDDGSYRFYYETGKEGGSHSRTEVRNPDGVVVGKFSYEDADGEMREVNYRADQAGFVAQGDVGVKGAPKGQFPVAQEETQPNQDPIAPSTSAVADQQQQQQPSEPKQDNTLPQRQQESHQPLVEAKQSGDHFRYDVEDKDDMQDLALEESSSADDPPEAFPPGFFLEKFHGLRRLPEPTREEKPSTTEAPPKVEEGKQPEKVIEKDEEEKKVEQPEVPAAADGPPSVNVPVEGSVFSFAPLKPSFLPAIPPPPPPQAAPHQEWASSMFHQPVYVFAYHQPDSYGYHYYY